MSKEIIKHDYIQKGYSFDQFYSCRKIFEEKLGKLETKHAFMYLYRRFGIPSPFYSSIK